MSATDSSSRKKRVARGVVYKRVNDETELRYLMAQRRFEDENLPGFFECFGGAAKDGEQDSLDLVLVRELREESGITVVRIVQPVHQFQRPFMHTPNEGEDGHRFDQYESMHFLIEAKIPAPLIIDPNEHVGYSYFTLAQLMKMKPVVRSCSFEAIVNADRYMFGHKIEF